MQRSPESDPSAAKGDAPRIGRAAEARRRHASCLVTVLFALTLAAVCPLVCKLPYSIDTLYALEGLLATGILVCGACALALLCG